MTKEELKKGRVVITGVDTEEKWNTVCEKVDWIDWIPDVGYNGCDGAIINNIARKLFNLDDSDLGITYEEFLKAFEPEGIECGVDKLVFKCTGEDCSNNVHHVLATEDNTTYCTACSTKHTLKLTETGYKAFPVKEDPLFDFEDWMSYDGWCRSVVSKYESVFKINQITEYNGSIIINPTPDLKSDSFEYNYDPEDIEIQDKSGNWVKPTKSVLKELKT